MLFKGKKRISVGIIGGAGYGGTELIKLLLFHPRASLIFVTSRKYSGLKIGEVHRFLRGHTQLTFVEPEIDSLPRDTDCIFLATPHGTSMKIVPELMKNFPKASIIDLSGDFRLNNPLVYKQYYGKEHTSATLMKKFVYGLTELNRDKIRKARYIANPGCFATGIIFALYPLVKHNLVKRDVTVISVTGSSGSGEIPKDVTHHPMRAKNFRSYKILEHQHLPEIEQFLKESFTEWEGEIGFIPQSGPFVRGIYTTVSAYNDQISESEVKDAFVSDYGDEKFIRIVGGSPEITMVYASNYVEVSSVYKRNFVVAMSAVDNLVRGASGQAVQNMNVIFGFEEDEGIRFPGMRP